jgi:hypothetical protein
VEDSTAIVSEYEENIQNPVPHGRYDEEIDGDDLCDVILQARTPSGRGRLASADHVLLDGRFGDDDTDFAELTKDAR